MPALPCQPALGACSGITMEMQTNRNAITVIPAVERKRDRIGLLTVSIHQSAAMEIMEVI